MKRISVILSTVLIFILIIGPLNILKEVVAPKTVENQVGRVHMNTGNTTRIMEENPDYLGEEISRILYPSISISQPSGLIIVQNQRWQDILALIPLMRKYDSPIIPVQFEISEELVSNIKQMQLKGISQLSNTQIIIFESGQRNLRDDLAGTDLKIRYEIYNNLEELQRLIYTYPEIMNNEEYGFIVPDNESLKSIPVATWIANEKGILIFLDESGNLNPSPKEVKGLNNLKKFYKIGKDNIDKDKNMFAENIKIETIDANGPESFAIKFAEFYDTELHVGWNADRNRNDNGHNYILASKDNPLLAITGTQLALKGKSGPLLWTDSNKLSSITENYLWKLKPNFWVTPTEGPFNNVWILGTERQINYGVQSRVDYTQEIASYEMMGEQGVGGLDTLSIIYLLASLGGALWITFHLMLRMDGLFILTKIMWIFTVLLLGPLGILLYIISYRNRPWIKMNNNTMWLRPLWNQAAVAVVMGLAFGASSMIVIGYLIAVRGMFLIPLEGRFGFYLLGNPMIISMIISYVGAFILNSIIFMPTMMMRMRKLSYIEAIKNSLLTVFISMTSVSIGMLISMWWLQMVYSPMMPEENHVLWWGMMQLATLIGALTAYVPNRFLVKYGRKMGTL